MIPKDYYYIQIQKNSGISDSELAVKIVSRLILDEENLDNFTASESRKIFNWALENLLASKIMTVESWLETAFHLCKQRWDSSVEWLESQPVPKVLLMVEIVNQHVKTVEAEMKKKGKK